jgi:cephalosporin hydroxylase
VIKIDLEAGTVTVEEGDRVETHPLDSPQAFAIVSRAWLRCGWDTKYVYGFSWMGRPIIQLPEDLLRVQELLYRVKPDVVVETGVAHGGSLIFYASLMKAMGKGRVIGIDIEIRPHNRAAIEAHEMFDRISLIEGSSIAPAVVEEVKERIAPGERVLVILDSNHEKDHVLKELKAYGEMVGVGSYILACDGIMGELPGAPRSQPDWTWNNPKRAAEEFLAGTDDFVLDPPPPPFNEGAITEPVTYWPGAYLKRVK